MVEVKRELTIGVYLYADKTKYDGEWKNNKRDGEGKLFIYL